MDTLKDYVKTATGLAPSTNTQALIKELSGTLNALAGLYKNFKLALPSRPDILVLQAQLSLAKAGEEHLVQIGLIQARLHLDLQRLEDLTTLATNIKRCVLEGKTPIEGPSNQQICTKVTTDDVGLQLTASANAYKDARAAFLASPTSAAENTQLTAKKSLDAQLSLLALGAALVARGNTGQRLAILREADENQRYAVRESSLSAQSYEQVLVNGAQRLSLYYQGGIHPDTLARLLNAAGALALVPTILSK